MLEDLQEGCVSQPLALADKATSPTIKDVADQLVYKLVRVEEDGTVVPATEDEVVQVESLLEEDTFLEPSKVKEKGTIVRCTEHVNIANKEFDTKQTIKISTGLRGIEGLEAERKKLVAQLEFLDAILQRLKDEEHQRALSEGIDSVTSCLCNDTKPNIDEDSRDHGGELQQPDSAFTVSRWEPKVDSKVLKFHARDELGRKWPFSGQQLLHTSTFAGEMGSPMSTSKQSWMGSTSQIVIKSKAKQKDSLSDLKVDSSVWDSELLKGDFCLDNLSIRELHEAFRTTFGRQTSVKDKQWLKRRIAMGLRSFHEVANNNVVLEGKRTAALAEEENFRVSLTENSPTKQFSPVSSNIANVGSKTPEEFPFDTEPKFLSHKKRSSRKTHPPTVMQGVVIDHPGGNSDHLGGNSDTSEKKSPSYVIGDKEGKRQRKPTKRYIEELTVSEARATSGKPHPVVIKVSDHGNFYLKSHVKNTPEDLESESVQPHLQISSLKFATGCRGRRGRPKKAYNVAMKYKSSGRAAQLVRKAISVRASRHSSKENVSRLKFKLQPLSGELMYESHNSGQNIGSIPYIMPSSLEPLTIAPELEPPDEHIEIIRTPKGGLRRKHHRPWTLREVMKLVEGVARCGVGKWAEIKKLAFSNSVYRTSVDLKDKWRNLLRASDTLLQASKQGEQRRKHTSAPIPGPILVRVRELAALQLQTESSFNETGISRSGRTVHRRHLI